MLKNVFFFYCKLFCQTQSSLSSLSKGRKVNTFSTRKRLMPFLQLQSSWEQTYIKQLVETFDRLKKNNAEIIIDAIKCLTRLKWVKKSFWRIKEGWREKVVNFHLNGVVAHSQLLWPIHSCCGPFTVHSMSNNNVNRALIKTNTMFPFWSHTST